MRLNRPNQNWKKQEKTEESFYIASQWQLTWWKFKRHKLAITGGTALIIFYFVTLFFEFFSPYEIQQRYSKYIYARPQRIHFFDEERFHFRPFVYGLKCKIDSITLQRISEENKNKKYPIYFFIRSYKYKLWNLFGTDLHLFGVRDGTIFLFGTDQLGRDMFSRVIYGTRISLSIGLIGIFLSFVIGLTMGSISGYYGGFADIVIQRIIELFRSIPTIPLWMALAAALPPHWSPIKIYFAITIILSFVGWTGLARVTRGKFLALREEDFIMAARLVGMNEGRIITKHLIPSFFTYIIVSLTLSIPGMILGETSLSFLGLGLRPPVISWGVLLQQAQNVQIVALYPWLLIPLFFVIVTVLAFNFLGDGLRDAADPYT